MDEQIDDILIRAAKELDALIGTPLHQLQEAVLMYQTYSQNNDRLRAIGFVQEINKQLDSMRKPEQRAVTDKNQDIKTPPEVTHTLEQDPGYSAASRSLRHDIRQPLAAISGCLELLTHPDPESRNRYFTLIDTGLRKIQMWLEIDKLHEISLKDLVNSVYNFFNTEKATLHLNPSDAKVYVIPSFTIRQLDQVIHNAAKAKREGTICTITLSCYEEGNYEVIAVQDNGKGIYPALILAAARTAGYTQNPATLYDTIELIFDTNVSGFKQTANEGNGVGLTSVALARKKGQRVDLETTIEQEGRLLTINQQNPNGYYDTSRTSTGTTFRFYFPLVQTANAQSPLQG